MRKVTHKHDIKEDWLVTKAFLLSEFFKKHWKKIVSLIFILFALLILIILMNNHQKSVRKIAVKEFATAMHAYKNKDYSNAKVKFLDLSKKYSSTPEHDWAFYYLGRIAVEQDSVDYAMAEENFKLAAARISNAYLKEGAFVALAKLYQTQGNRTAYIDGIKKIVRKFPQNFNTPNYLYEIGDYYYFEEQDAVQAKKYYKKILSLNNSSMTTKAQKRLDTIK